MARSASVVGNTKISSTWANGLITDYLSQTDTTEQNLASNLNITTKVLKRTFTAITLGFGVTTFAAVGEFMQITGDGAGNNLATITGGIAGQTLIIICVDAVVVFVNDDGHGANTIDLVGAGNLTSADDTTLTLVFDGTSWYETSRSVN